MKYQFKTKPYTHQRDGLKLAAQHKAIGLFCEPGTGKSKIAIDYAGVLQESNRIKCVLIVCPLSVSGVWVNEIKRHLPLRFSRRVIKLSGLGSKSILHMQRVKPRDGVLDFYIINYDSLWRVQEEFVKLLQKKYGGRSGKISSKNLQHGFDYMWYDDEFETCLKRVVVDDGSVPILIVADEVHKIKSRGARRSQAMHKIAALTPYRLGLTGTPITNKPLDIWSQYKFISPHTFGLNYKVFQNRYAIMGGYGGYQVSEYRNLADLQKRLHSKALVVKKVDCLDLPDKTFEIIPIILSERTKAVYREMAKKLITEIEEYIAEGKNGDKFRASASIVLTKLLRLSQITSGFVKDVDGVIRRVGKEKLVVALDLLETLTESDESVVVFCRFRQEIKDLKDGLSELGIETREIQGDVPEDKRTEYIQDFQDKKYSVIICQIASGSLGITLTAAHTAMFYNLDYSADNYIQAQDRIHRIGQTEKVTYLHLLAKHSVDEMVYDSLCGKLKLADTILQKPGVLLEQLGAL